MSRWSTLTGQPTQVIAHRGNSGQYPEHVLPGYQSALDLGVDVIEPDLVATGDGVLFCRHDLDLRRSTDVAQRPEFAEWERNGEFSVLGFAADEVDRLRAIQPFPGRDPAFDGRFAPPRFAALLDWAAAQAAQRGRPVVLYPELKHPEAHQAQNIDITARFIEHCRTLPPGVELLLQCFSLDTLRRLKRETGLPVALLLDSSQSPELVLAEHADWLDGLALSKKLLFGEAGARRVDAIHTHGLRVDVWTLRDDQPAPGFTSIGEELSYFYALGVDRLFADFPATALEQRNAFEQL